MERILLLLAALAFCGNAYSWKQFVLSRDPDNEPRYVGFFDTEDAFESRATCTCGVKNFNKIVGGNNAKRNEYPWMAAICYGKTCNVRNQFCGGSLINDRYILTAAHCTEGLTAGEITVSLGDHNLASKLDTNSVEYRASKIIMHKGYNSNTLRNDIALIRLNRKVRMRNTISPICLPPPKQAIVGETAWVTGWGHTTHQGSSSKYLKEVSLKVISYNECKKAYGVGEITGRMLCATKKNSDSCQGDSGGPLIHEHSKGYYEQIGVVSWGIGCGDSRYPGVYTRVSSYLKWIKIFAKALASFCTTPN